MTSIILQYANTDHKKYLDLSSPVNKKYADKFGFTQVIDKTRRCPERSIYWEKIAYLNTYLLTVEDGTLVAWIDADSFAVGNEDLHAALPANGVLGMVQLRGGLGGRQIVNWYNAGFIVMINSPAIREFFNCVWDRNTPTDEDAINAEIKHRGSIITDGIPISSLDVKWNCWNNNISLCSSPVIRSFHGLNTANKLSEMTTFVNQLPK